MLSVLLVMSLLTAPPATVQSRAVPTHAEGEALARDQQFEAALDTFRRIAAANPRDHQARLWIARIHGWMGHPRQAEPVYRSVLLEDPSNLDAMFGLGMTLIELGETDEAVKVLERAESAQPQNADVLAGLSQGHSLAGRSTRAVLYAERALSIEPTERHRVTLEQARVRHGHRVEITSFGEDYNTSTDETGSVDLRLNFRAQDDLRVIARGQHQQKFGFSEQRGGAGLEWRWGPRTSLLTHVLFGPRDNQVLPRVDVNGEIVHAEGAAVWVAGYRYFDFPSAQVSVISPGVTWFPHARISLAARYYAAITDFAAPGNGETGHSLALRAAHQVVPRLWINGGYTRGTENFENLSPDRVGAFRANTATGGLRIDLRSLTSILGQYEYQWRPLDVRMQRFSLSLHQRF
jgi:YaiO family outer membrane protein